MVSCYLRFAEPSHIDDHSSDKNPVLLFARIVVGGLFVELSQLKDKTEIPYVTLRLDRACVDVTLAEFTVYVVAQLCSVQLIDKQNLGTFQPQLDDCLTCFLKAFFLSLARCKEQVKNVSSVSLSVLESVWEIL